jgi:3-hydroxybutyryl-CoA dehydrogenase
LREAGGFRMGPFELMDLIGHDVNFAVTRSVWESYFHDPRFTPSLLQQELVLAGFLGRKSGRGFYDYGSGAVKPEPATEPARPAPDRIVAYGDLGVAASLVDRIAALGLPIERRDAHAQFDSGVIAAGSAWLALSDGRTATERAVANGAHDLVLFDLAFDFHAAKRLAVARADTCSDAAYGAAVGMLQAAGLAVSPIDDVAGLPVMRTVAMLANEAADAVQQGIASADDIDLAMQKGVNYPMGPLAWGDAIGCRPLFQMLTNMRAASGNGRYRISPLIARRCATGGSLLAKR